MKTPRGSTFLVTTMLSLIQILSATTSLAPTAAIPQTTWGISTRAPQETTVLSTENPTTSTLLNTLVTIQTTNSTTTTTRRTTTTTTSAVFPPISCENGGTFDGGRCICPDIFYGVTCSNIVDSVVITGRKYDLRVTVPCRILNRDYKDEYSDRTSQEYKDFENEFKDQMRYLYREIPEYKEVDILALGPGSVYVHSIVTLEIEMGVNFRYKEVADMLFDTLSKLKNCTDWTSTYCIDFSYIMYKVPPSDLCYAAIPYSYADFYSLIDTNGHLVCVSVCNANSPDYFNCNKGSCELNYSGPQCLCPSPDMYVYITSQCGGQILLAALYGGIGSFIGVLLISSFIVIFFLCRAKRSREGHVHEDMKKNTVSFTETIM